VDDLKEGRGAEYIDVSVSTLVLSSAPYFASKTATLSTSGALTNVLAYNYMHMHFVYVPPDRSQLRA
jgi:hypothetical protein